MNTKDVKTSSAENQAHAGKQANYREHKQVKV